MATASPPTTRYAPVAWALPVAGLATVVLLLVIYPPFHVVSKQTSATVANATSAATFDAVALAAELWTAKLVPAAARAPELAPLLADLRRDPRAALQRHGRSVGLGNAGYYFARGTGRIIAVERSRVLVDIDGAIIAVRTGPVFGNVVRDGCGLLEVNQVPGLAEFNAFSAELNRLVEQQVQPALKASAVIGAMLTFAGCAEAPEALPPAGTPLLTFIPVQAEVKP